MSEQSMGAEMASPRQRAVAYLEMRQGARRGVGKEKNVKTPLIPDKVRRPEPLVDTVAAYEKMMDRLGDKGYEGAEKALSELRPAAYDAAQVIQMGARVTDALLTVGLWFIPMRGRGLPVRAAAKLGATAAMIRFRPLEWAVAQGAKAGGFIASSEMAAPVVNMILRGGERVQQAPEPKPAAA